MHKLRRRVQALAVAPVLMFGLVVLAPPASAAPYTDTPTIAVSTANPSVRGRLTVSGQGFAPNERVAIDLYSKVRRLRTVRADALGNYSTTVVLPGGFRCTHTIVATGLRSGRTASAKILIGRPASCRNKGNGNGNGNGPGKGHGHGKGLFELERAGRLRGDVSARLNV
jgi:hypothetical protein